MKRTASVAGFLHVEAGRCRLELTHAEPSVSPADPRVSPAGSTSHPPMATIMSEIASSAAVHSTKQSLQLRQVQSHVNYIQRSLNLPTGTLGGWNPQAQEMLWTWLAAPKKGSKAKAALLSIKDKASSETEEAAKIEDVNNIVESETAKIEDDSKVAEPETAKTEDEDNIAEPETAQIEDDSKIAEPKETAECNSDSSYSSSDSEESVLDHVVDTSGWPTDWHDTWECAIGLANSSGNSSTKLRVAQRLMKTIFAAKQQWDAST